MSQELIDSVTALTEETTQLLEVYTQESLTLNTKVANAADSAAAAKASEDAAASSETNAANSEVLALQYKNEAEILTQLATWQQYKADAELAADNASASEQASKVSETNSLASEQASKISEVNSLASEEASKQSELNSAASEEASKVSETNSLASENASKNSELASLASEQASKVSETNSLASEQASKQSELNSAASELATKTSETNAANSANLADAHQQTTLGYRNEAEQFSLDAYASDQSAAEHAAATLGYKNEAAQSATDSEASNQSSASHNASASQHRVDAQAAATNAANSESNVSQSEANVIALEANVTTMESNVTAIEQTVEQHKVDSAASAASAKADADRAASAVGDVTWKQYARKDAEMEQVRQQNKDARAASGFDHMGKHYDLSGSDAATAINEGMWARTTTSPNELHLGRTYSDATGSSVTDYPVLCVAGILSKLLHKNVATGHGDFPIKFREAPNGTVIFDSSGDVRGSGKAQLDLSVDIDPKYGDVAVDETEAAIRAFEGDAPNGDFRLGDDGNWSVLSANSYDITDGVLTFESGGTSGSRVRNIPYRSLLTGESARIQVRFRRLGNISGAVALNIFLSEHLQNTSGRPYIATSIADGDTSWHTVDGILTADRDDMGLMIAGNTASVGETFEVEYGLFSHTTEEVVINPVDMFGCESWLEIVSEAKPYVYSGGGVQTQVTEMNGIATERSNRPDTYYSVYDGDLESAGLGVDFWSATTEQKIAMLIDVDNNLFLVKDEYGVDTVVQWRHRQCTERSLGNGDWFNVFPNNEYSLQHIVGGSYVRPQGALDEKPTHGVFRSTLYPTNPKPEVGVFTSNEGQTGTGSMFGHCYFHVWGVVSRLNQGIYSDSFNPMGSAKDISGNSGVKSTLVKSALDCFLNAGDGSLAGAASGRPDGKFHDGIYASGQGGVIDYRMPSWCMGSPEIASWIFQQLVNGTYRGKECLTFTKPYEKIAPSTDATSTTVYLPDGTKNFASNGDMVSVVDSTGTVVITNAIITGLDSRDTNPYVAWDSAQGGTFNRISGSTYYPVITKKTNIPVSGNFNRMDVSAEPIDILNTPALANGWVGGWMGLPVGSSTKLSRKYTEISATPRLYSDDFGASWVKVSANPNAVKNTAYAELGVNILNYTAFAKQTKQSANKPVFGGMGGVGDVWAGMRSSASDGSLLAESLMGKILTCNNSLFPNRNNYKVLQANIWNTGVLDTDSGQNIIHAPIDLTAPDNDSPAVKALWHPTSDNQVANLNLIWNELKYNAPAATGNITAGSAFSFGANIRVYLSGFDNTDFDGVWLVTKRAVAATWSASALNKWAVIGDEVLTNMDTVPDVSEDLGRIYRGSFWNDDGTMRIISGQGTYNNTIGETCLYGTHELAIPYGFVKNQARPGAQVAGVSL